MAFRTLNSITHVTLSSIFHLPNFSEYCFQMLAPVVLAENGDHNESAHVDGLGWARVKHQALVGNSGNMLAAGLYLSIVLQHSDTETDGDFAAVTDQELLEETFDDAASGRLALINVPAEDQVVVNAEYKQSHPNAKRYTRLSFVQVGNHANGIPCGAIGTKYHPETPNADEY